MKDRHFAVMGPALGRASVSIDGATPIIVDLYAPARFPLTPSDCYEAQGNLHPSTVPQPQKASNAIVEISHWFGQ